MGQKTHPKGFRLITTQKHLSEWYSSKIKYALLIEEDYFIRLKVYNLFKEFLSISRIEIVRTIHELNSQEYVNLKIYTLFPRAKEMSRKVSKYFNEINKIKLPIINNSKNSLKIFTTLLLKRNIRNLIRCLQVETKKNYCVTVEFIKNPFEDVVLIAKFISDQLEKRIPFRRAVKQTIKKVKNTTIKGIKVEVSGRLNGIDIARSEWKRDGCVPLHTLNANIDYTCQTAHTIYGVIGIKVWLFT
jgi:small subunit ribosomal protein S3